MPRNDEPLTFAWGTIDEALSEGVADLLALHWDEVALDKDTIPLDPDWEQYKADEKAGTFKAILARRGNRLIGYNAFWVHTPHHYRSSTHILNDILYIDPEERGIAGVRMIRESEKMLSSLAPLVKIIYHSKLHVLLGIEGSGTVGTLLERLGYSHIENIHAKVVRNVRSTRS